MTQENRTHKEKDINEKPQHIIYNINMADRFEKNLREKLKDYERPVPEDIWKGIEQGMAGRRKRGRRIMPIWYATAGIAAAACLLVVMYMKNDTQMQQTVADTERRHNARKAVDNAVDDVMGSDIIAGITAMAENGTREKTMTAHLTAPETDDEGSMTTTAEEKQQVDNGGEAENTGSTLPEEDKSRQGMQTEKKQEDRKWDTNPHKDNSKDRTGDTRRRDRGGRLSASIYGTGVPSSQNAKAGNMIMSSSAANIAGYKNMLQAVTPEPATEATHSIPFKFGVSLRYGLTRNIGLEGGVRYTMLKSKFTQKPSHAENHQDVGMVGIPIALTYKIYGNRTFETYGSIGGEVAKTVKADDDVYSDLAKPWQLSANAAVGAQYNITPAIGLYIEPSVGYYFDNGSGLRTTYSDHPFNFNVSVGLRFSAH